MATGVAAIWRKPSINGHHRLEACIRDAANARSAVTRIFFRADDVAVPSSRFQDMIQIFVRHAVPLNLAVVPAWLTAQRWRALTRIGKAAPRLWCWHQHGWRHTNHEPQGKKQEFGPARPAEALRRDLDRGRERLERLMGTRFFPVFTPPWNRCSAEVLDHLRRTGYAAVSRSTGGTPVVPRGLAELAVDIDLHTRKEATTVEGWQALTADLACGLARPVCGIMLHHQRMNTTALAVLDDLLKHLRASPRFEFQSFKGLVKQ
ncbi:MAG: polysaccharide deacetylase family protein [Desulfobacterales bacterium]|nr:polysaccharide deacetylase family protein [Desulfobacterales bacterium]